MNENVIQAPSPDGTVVLVAIPGYEICDFCLATPVVWEYRVFPDVIIDLGSAIFSDELLACAACKQLVDREAYADLIERVVAAHDQGMPRGMTTALITAFVAIKDGPGHTFP